MSFVSPEHGTVRAQQTGRCDLRSRLPALFGLPLPLAAPLPLSEPVIAQRHRGVPPKPIRVVRPLKRQRRHAATQASFVTR
eukprot:3379286-Rhodomonas_salina.1